MAGRQPSVEVLLERFSGEVKSAFYPFFVLSAIRRLDNPSISEVRREIAENCPGIERHSLASDKQLLGRMDKTFGLIDCVGGAQEDRRYRINSKGSRLLQDSSEDVIEPLLATISSLQD